MSLLRARPARLAKARRVPMVDAGGVDAAAAVADVRMTSLLLRAQLCLRARRKDLRVRRRRSLPTHLKVSRSLMRL